MQDPLPVKIYEGPEENNGKGPGNGHFMSDNEKSINKSLADSLYNQFSPEKVFDIGCKYPYLLKCFKDKSEILGIDAIEEIEDYGKELEIPVIKGDFEKLNLSNLKGKFDLITLIHTFEHFYNPLESLKKITECLNNYGVIFIRLPNFDVKGIQKDFTDHHLKIHPYIYSNQAIHILAEKLNLEIFKYDHLNGDGQTDFYLRVKKIRPDLSVCMIVKNEEKNIIDCLETVKDIADELIIVDTGSEDNTKEIVSRYTNIIYDYKWNDDFSAARNYSLSKAIGKFILWLDADDILENPDNIKPLLKEDFDVYNFNIKYGNDIFCQARLFKNYKNIKFHGRVHEYPIIDNLAFKDKTNINVIHKTEKHCTENRSFRNLRILEKELIQDPDNSRAIFYMANTLRELNRLDEALDKYEDYLKIARWKDERWMAQKYMGQIYIQQKDFKLALQSFKKAIEIDDRWAESYYYMGESYFYLKNYEECIDWMKKALSKSLPDSPLWKEIPVYRDLPYRYISACFIEMNQLELALEYCEKALEINPDDPWLKNRINHLKEKINGNPQVIECYRQGALGDCLMTTSALRGLKEKYPGCFIRYVTHEHSMQILEGNKFIDELTIIPKSDTTMKVYFSYPDKNSPVKNEDYPNKPLKRHLVKIFNECADINTLYPLECTLTLDDEKLAKSIVGEYITIHIKSGWSEYKDWYLDRWEKLVDKLFEQGYKTIQIGHNSDPSVYNAIDCRGRTVKEAVGLIKYARLHIGIDSFSNHAAVAVATPAVILFGSTSPMGSGYVGNINIYKNLDCQPCYREYESSPGYKGPCPYNKKCMFLITVDEVFKEAIDILSL